MALSLHVVEAQRVSRALVTEDAPAVEPGAKLEVAEIIEEVHELRLVSWLKAVKNFVHESDIPEGMYELED